MNLAFSSSYIVPPSLSMQHAPLLSLPAELIEETALYVACSTLAGRPNSIRSFSSIFKRKFSHSAVARRSFEPTSKEYRQLLQLYDDSLQFIEERRGPRWKEPVDADHMSTEEVLWVLTFMCLDDDGANTLQLNTVVIMVDGRSTTAGILWHYGCFWSLSTKERILSEPEDVSDRIVNLILPFVTIPFRYPMAFAPSQSLYPPTGFPSLADFSNANTSARIPFRTRQTHLLSVLTPHGPFPIYRSTDPIWLQVYFTRRIEVTWPLITAAAKLLLCEEGERGMTGATQADIIEINRNRLGGSQRVTNVGPDGIDERSQASRLYDADWYRLRLCGNVWANSHGDDDEIWRRVKLGKKMLVRQGNGDSKVKVSTRGRVYSRLVNGIVGLDIPNEQALAQLLMVQNPNPQQHNGHPVPLPAGFDEMLLSLTNRPHIYEITRPLSFYEDAEGDEEEEEEEDMDDSPVPEITDQRLLEEFDQGLQNAYFPDGVTEESFKGTYDGTGMRMICGGKEEKQAMPAWSEEEHPADMVPLPPCTGVQDVIVTGSTDDRHGQAWNHYVYYGRVRRWDGMIGILRVPRDRGLGKWFFYGYIVGGKNFVGNWRITHEDPGCRRLKERFVYRR
ncbi:uncharacterized protein EV420DRAFT_1702421 [Desarmillaria tabescens]|uniref:Uncharacterized protein n=1 Tax=Armillaria tabescens TaxID=1929756 RepID=A0AA39K253_ARMTA|nr:uncharacterized protein EV420DRAFT_1702421 [Desarmillaria tabescens]KAK0452055.1 hypothetical protein EV420DRAFT_1702421 [Desarmillaria tabescens]